MDTEQARKIVFTLLQDTDIAAAFETAFKNCSSTLVVSLRVAARTGDTVKAAWIDGKISATEDSMAALKQFASNYSVHRSTE